MTISALLRYCAVSFVFHTLLVAQYLLHLVHPLHDSLQRHHSCGPTLGYANKLRQLLDKNILHDFIFTARNKSIYSSNTGSNEDTDCIAFSSADHIVPQVLAPVTDKSSMSFWAHGPTSTPRRTSAPPAKGRGKQRSGAGVGKSGGRTPLSRTRKSDNGNGNDNDGNDESDDDGDKNKRDDLNLEDDRAVAPLYACPFFKFDPKKYSRCFRKYELRRPCDVKQHILRCHTFEGLYCVRCWSSWTAAKAPEWDAHVAILSCIRLPQPDLLLPHERDWLRDMRLDGSDESAKWYRMWNLLFANHQQPPSPYVDYGPGEVLGTLDSCRENLLQQLPRFVLQLRNSVTTEEEQAIGHEIDAIYRLPFNLDHAQAPRSRRQRALQQPSSDQLAPFAVASEHTTAPQPHLVSTGPDEVDWDHWERFLAMDGAAGDDSAPGPHPPPPHPPDAPAPRG